MRRFCENCFWNRSLAGQLVGFVLAAIVALSAAVVAEALDPSVRGTRDIRDILAVSPLVSVPVISNSIATQAHRKRLLRFSTYAAASVVAMYVLSVRLFV